MLRRALSRHSLLVTSLQRLHGCRATAAQGLLQSHWDPFLAHAVRQSTAPWTQWCPFSSSPAVRALLRRRLTPSLHTAGRLLPSCSKLGQAGQSGLCSAAGKRDAGAHPEQRAGAQER